MHSSPYNYLFPRRRDHTMVLPASWSEASKLLRAGFSRAFLSTVELTKIALPDLRSSRLIVDLETEVS